jgi:hypothetical protein
MWQTIGMAGVMLLLAGCGLGLGQAAPTGFELRYSTGAIPPPYNYSYRVGGEFRGEQLVISYTLTYNYRESMSAEELQGQGYSPDDDLAWAGTLVGAEAQAWQAVAQETQLQTRGEMAVGGDWIEVTLRAAGGQTRQGLPSNREAWERLAAALDARVRAELGHSRSAP